MVGFKYKEWIDKLESNNKRMGSLPSTINLPRREAAFASFMFAYLIHGKQHTTYNKQQTTTTTTTTTTKTTTTEKNVRVLSYKKQITKHKQRTLERVPVERR